MATFSHTSGESDISQPTWSHTTGISDISQPTWSQSFQEVAASWYALESVAFGFIFWEGFDDVNWEDMTTSTSYLENWEDMG
jgi:hypothetical protein